jgi:hypothetical protein
MTYLLNAPWLLGFLLAIFLAGVIELGRKTASLLRVDDENRKEQMVAIRDGLFLLTSLLLGFTMALAVPRYTERRSLLIEESVSIGTTYLRADLLPQPYRDNSRALLRRYVDTRLDLDAAGLDAASFNDAASRSSEIQSKLWSDAVAVAQTDRTSITATYITSLNETIDLHDKRLASLENRIPLPVWFLVITISAIAAFSRGVTQPRRFWLTLVLAPITIAIVVALIADLDSPSTGMLRIDQRAMQRLKSEIDADR